MYSLAIGYLSYYIFIIYFLGTPIRGLTHHAYVRASKYGIQIPWVGMDNSGCPYLEENCNGNGKKNLAFKYAMKVEDYYPPV